MGPGAILAVILIVIAAVAVYVGRGGSVPGFSGGNSGGSRDFFGGEKTVVKAIVGSEKKPFFEDKEVQKALASHGYAVEVDGGFASDGHGCESGFLRHGVSIIGPCSGEDC